MSRMNLYRWLPLLGVMGGLGGCATPELETAEPLAQLQGEAIVSSITEGDYVIRSAMTNKCIDIASSNTADGAKVQQWDCNGTNAQKFHISPTSDGYWKIINVNSGKGLDIKEVSTAANAEVHQWSYVGGANQQFRFVGRGNNQFSIHVRHTDMAIDLYWGSADNGTIYVQYPYTGTSNQHYTFDKVDGGTQPPPTGTGIAAILSESTFNTMFPSRNGFYTYAALVAAANTFPSFATSGDTATRKREVAAFLANISHETGGLVYIEEINKSVMCDTSWGPPGCGCAAGKWYYGRGPIQLSWNGNYCAAGNALGVDLKNNPDLVAQNATIAWRTGFWFWMTQTGAGSMTGHDAIVNGAGFGETIRTINGALECNGRNPAQVDSRVNNYNRFLGLLGASAVGNNRC
ncbi:RICIN domain-containing protein [Stigmatella aurantiaca]|uniref:Chitinase class I subfamily, putative n=1 Tax=Stigmatella aurantiaca (strain DW4/3-1) TaxID=378806 RepID=Q08TW9_STIAD|nr:RICIN domain-containing protein [Stigmatella aurantiaca]ADO71790.1 Chitinase, class I [Stigmatella aurantiaca DW4/3-1]EAU63930.1 chitinase class I subfamily, putative [Stigmatella aurantiaca DW4/3-1]